MRAVSFNKKARDMMSPDKIFLIVNDVRVSLSEFRNMRSEDIRTVDARGCAGLTELHADNATTVYARGCTICCQ